MLHIFKKELISIQHRTQTMLIYIFWQILSKTILIKSMTVGNFPGQMTDLNIWNLPIDHITLDNYMNCNDPLFLHQPPTLINWNKYKLAKKGNMTYNTMMPRSTVCPNMAGKKTDFK